MHTKTQINQDLLQEEITSNEAVDTIFNSLEKELLDQSEITLNFQSVSFISVYFLERLEQFIQKSKIDNPAKGEARQGRHKLTITNVPPSIYKVFQVARSKTILEICL